MNIFVEKLKRRVDELHTEGKSDIIIMNILKEEIQYAVLDFIYKNRDYSSLVMYGGSLLRIAYRLPRMSEDLDFQTDKKFDFGKFKSDIITHFKSAYSVDIEVDLKTERMTKTDLAFIKFPYILDEIGFKGGRTVLKIRFDVNSFTSTSKFTIETIPITHDMYVFSIKTYPMATLMASKVAAVLLRTERGIGDEKAPCKPRDIYDLIWYMQEKIIPDIEYLRAIFERAGKKLEANNVLELFDRIMLRVTNLDAALFKDDLAPFFYDPAELDFWLHDWRGRIISLRKEYDIFRVKDLLPHEIYVGKDFSSDTRYFHFWFETEPDMLIKITFVLSDYWYVFADYKITPGHRRKDVESRIVQKEKLNELDYEYIGLFYTKIEDYLRRNDSLVLHDEIKTKLIRPSAENLNVKTQILLDRRLLTTVRFEDLI
ncbi:nucleotidyl transferase AbiEii/AbiGii toxin family protein [Candidatus Peregrinibacteria bacterium]|nr:nucleotidyl transferase AbiEii/AbiGii toxin family protein [Candidatus Peregrinibacteria bacterium]